MIARWQPQSHGISTEVKQFLFYVFLLLEKCKRDLQKMPLLHQLPFSSQKNILQKGISGYK